MLLYIFLQKNVSCLIVNNMFLFIVHSNSCFWNFYHVRGVLCSVEIHYVQTICIISRIIQLQHEYVTSDLETALIYFVMLFDCLLDS